MFKIRFEKKGVVLLIVLGMLLVVVSLVTVMLSFILSHARLTHHQTSRIQAYYASMAGINYALEKLRLGNDNNWQLPALPANNYYHYLCQNNSVSQCASDSAPVIESDLPSSIQYVQIRVAARNTSGTSEWPGGCYPSQGITCVNARTYYTYTAP